jgi:hypothetical protein
MSAHPHHYALLMNYMLGAPPSLVVSQFIIHPSILSMAMPLKLDQFT